jgi:hypothetical protein
MSFEINSDASLAFLPGQQLLITLVDPSPKRDPRTPVEKKYGNQTWVSNDYWREVYERTKRNSLIHPTLAWQSNQLAACNLIYGTIRGFDKNMNEIFEPLQIPEIDEFLDANDMELYMEETLRDLKWWSHAFPEFRLNEERSRIVSLSVYDALHCCFSEQNTTTGNKDYVYVSANWPRERGETWMKIKCLDPYWNVNGQIANSKQTEFIYPLSFSSPGRIYIQDTPWHRIIDSNWLDVAEAIPLFKKYLMEHQMTIKYVIHVPLSWWKWKYPKWESLSPEEKSTVRKKELSTFEGALTGVKKTGKTLMLTFNDNANGKQYTKWEVQELKGSSLGDGAYIEDSKEASEHILFSLAQHASLMGNTPGKGMGAGSGSDIRVSNNVFFINNRPFINKAKKPYEKITSFNGWVGPKKEKVVWRAANYFIETTDTKKEISQSNGNQDNANS